MDGLTGLLSKADFFTSKRAPLTQALFAYIGASFALLLIKPKFMFYEDGTPKALGVDKKTQTLLPLWLCSFVAGFLVYIMEVVHRVV